MRALASFLVLFMSAAASAQTPTFESRGTALRDATLSAHSSDLVAAWTTRELFLSTDGGMTFGAVLTGPGDIWDAAFAPNGTLWVLRGGRLGRRAPRGRETWERLPRNSGVSHWSTDEDLVRNRSFVNPAPELPKLVIGARRVVIAVPVSDAAPVPPRVARLEEAPVLVHLFTRGLGSRRWRRSRVRATMVSSSIGVSDGIRALALDAAGRLHLSFSWAQGNACAARYLTRFRGDPTTRLQVVDESDDDEYFEVVGLRHGRCTAASETACVGIRGSELRRFSPGAGWSPLPGATIRTGW